MLCPSGLAQHWPYYGTTVRRPLRPPRPPAIDPLPAQQVSRYPVRPVTGGRRHPPTITLHSPKVIIMLHYDNSTPPNHN